MKQLTKVPMVRALAKGADIPVVQAEFIYDVFYDIMLRRIKEGYDVVLPNIGTIRQVPGRELISNLTGQKVPPHKRLRFKLNIHLARFIRVHTRAYKIK
jgi:nucleoid DNA-binding protein